MTNTFTVKPNLAIDVSYYEPIWYERANYDLVNPKPRHVIARATFGVRQDTYFKNHWDYWRGKGIPVAAYHYWYGTPMYSGQSASDGIGDQAENFIRQIMAAGYTGKEKLWIDLEEAGNSTVPNGRTYQNLAKQWLDHVERETGQKPGIYSRTDQLYRMAIRDVMPEWINDYDFWLAWYPNGPYIDRNAWFPTSTKYRPSWLKKEPVMWQYSEDGYIDGFVMQDNHQPTTYDFNMCLPGYLESLGVSVPVDEVEEPTTEIIYQTGENTMKGTAKAITNIKPMAGGTAIAQMQVGDYAYGTVASTDLIGFDHYYHNGAIVKLNAVCKAYLGNLNLVNEAEPVVVVDPPIDPPPASDTSHVIELFIDGVLEFKKVLD